MGTKSLSKPASVDLLSPDTIPVCEEMHKNPHGKPVRGGGRSTLLCMGTTVKQGLNWHSVRLEDSCPVFMYSDAFCLAPSS